jgi:hypothetical protein
VITATTIILAIVVVLFLFVVAVWTIDDGERACADADQYDL